MTRTQTPFAQALIASGLLSADQVAGARAVAGGDSKTLAAHLVREGLLTPFQVRQLRAGATSFHIGKYVVVGCLGRGGNSIVFKARHTLLPQRHVALKTLDARNLHEGQDVLARFRREIDIVTRLDHPNVVHAYDVIQTRRQLYLVLEYVEGPNLSNVVCDRGPLPVAEAVGYALQAAKGLAYAHRMGVIHRDLKPANLLLTPDGMVKLADLGLAKFFGREADGDLTTAGLCMGTPEFMAPEQAEDARKADARSDLFSLGATLFHLLTGELPVNGSSYLHKLQTLLTLPPRPLAESRSTVPAGLAEVVDRLRARAPADRPASVEEAIALLEPFAQTHDAENPSRWDGRRRAELVLGVLRGELTATEAAARHGLAPEEFERWRQRFLTGAEKALDPRRAAGKDSKEILIRDLHAKIGAQAMELESLRKRMGSKAE